MATSNLDKQLSNGGIRINPDYSTTISNDVLFNSKFWHSKNGKRVSAYAPIVYSWCVDKTTNNIEDDGVTYGRVLGGSPVSLAVIAETLGVAWTTVQRAMNHLVEVGLIRRARASKMQEYSYSVINSRKKFKVVDPRTKGVTRRVPLMPDPYPLENDAYDEEDELL